MNTLTLKHLRYFEALAAQGHFGRAAETCSISQPALSLQIKELESLIGAPLVERGARQIRLTALGEDFLDRARAVLLQVDELGNLGRSAQGPLSGRLRIGAIPTVAPYMLPQIITALSDRFPGLELQPRETVTQSLIEELQASRLDLAVLALPISEPSLQEFTLFEEDFHLVRPLAEAGEPIPDAAELDTMRLLLLEEGHCFRDQALDFCEASGARPRQVMEGSSLSTLVQMVGAGIGVTLIPDMAVALETRDASVVTTRFHPPRPRRTIGMVWRKTNPLAEPLMQIGAIIRQAACPVPQSRG